MALIHRVIYSPCPVLGLGAAETLKAEFGESVVNLSSSHSGLPQGIILIIRVHYGAVVIWGNV